MESKQSTQETSPTPNCKAEGHTSSKDVIEEQPGRKKSAKRLPSLYATIKQSGFLEIAGLAVSFVAILAIFGLLLKYNNKPISGWTRKFSFNGVISLLSTVASLGIAQCAQHAVGQLKWVRFAKGEHELYDIQSFDSASRGPRGAFRMLTRHPSFNFASIGVLVVLLRIAFEPFTQNLVQFYDGPFTSGFHTAVTSKNPVYESHGSQIGPFVYDLSPDLIGNMYTAVFQPTQTQLLQPQFICLTGNCTWDPFTTFAFCPYCTDVSSKLSYNWTQGFLDSVAFTGGFSSVNLSSANFSGDGGFGATSNGLLHEYLVISKLPLGTMGYVYNSSIGAVWLSIRADIPIGLTSDNSSTFDYNIPVIDNTTKIIGMECAMMPCVMSLNATAINGAYQEQVLDTFTDAEILGPAGRQSLSLHPPWGPERGMEKGQTFGMATQAFTPLTQTGMSFDKIFSGSVESSGENDGEAFTFTSDQMRAIFYANFTRSSCDSQDKIVCSFQAFTKGINKAIRDAPLIENGNIVNSTYLAKGNALINTTFIRVRWEWLSLPVFILFLSFISWLGAIWQTKRAGLPWWDVKILPLLYLYREETGEGGLIEEAGNVIVEESGFDSSITGYMERSEAVKASLVFAGERPRLRLNSD